MTCSIENCTNKIVAWGLCDNHYRRLKRNGSPHIHCNKPWGKAKTIRADGYVYITVTGKQVMEHRYLKEQELKRKLTADEIVHHIDGNRQNNELNNLRVMSRADHSKLHRAEAVTYGGKFLSGVKGVLVSNVETLKKED